MPGVRVIGNNCWTFSTAQYLKMGKRNRKDDATTADKSKTPNHRKSAVLVNDEAVDPTLALLFASSVCIIFPLLY
jgi:hypothetical protein